MAGQDWIVKSGSADWGLIKRLVINPGTRQINYVDVFVIHTASIARYPWDNFAISNEGITLSIPEPQATDAGMASAEVQTGSVVSINVWP
jgi:hypothetical protein